MNESVHTHTYTYSKSTLSGSGKLSVPAKHRQCILLTCKRSTLATCVSDYKKPQHAKHTYIICYKVRKF